VCWQDQRHGDWDIYARLYHNSGEALGANFKVNDDIGTSKQCSPSVAMNADGSFVICWQDNRNGDWDIYAQRYHSDGTPRRTNYLANQRPDAANPNQLSPSVAVNKNRICFTWRDDRRSAGWDIYAKVVTWDWEKVDEPGDDIGLPEDYALFQNYPNPFNATTAISYQSSGVSYQQSAVSLKIYNILGQEVRTLVNEQQPAGNYRVLWDGRDSSGKDLSSGIYFCRLKVIGETLRVEKTRRMVLIR